MLGSREPGKNLTKKYWNVYCELVLRLFRNYIDDWCVLIVCFFFFTSVWMLTSLYLVLFCTSTFTYSCFFVCFFVCFFLLMNFRKVCTCPCGRYVKENKCWWHALQNVTKKNICAFCIKLFGLCLVFIGLDAFTHYFHRIKFHFIGI